MSNLTDIKLTNMTEEQVEVLKSEAAKVGMTVTGFVKLLCQEMISKNKEIEKMRVEGMKK